MATHAQAAEAAARIQALANEYASALDAVVASVGPQVWTGGGADEFAQGLASHRLRVRQAFADAALGAERLVAMTLDAGSP